MPFRQVGKLYRIFTSRFRVSDRAVTKGLRAAWNCPQGFDLSVGIELGFNVRSILYHGSPEFW
ncbi:MAG: hypothetical protein ACI97A_000879 [Planctomycetota bacterium]|jgi:hypothetical protein